MNVRHVAAYEIRHAARRVVSPDGVINQAFFDLLFPNFMVLYANVEILCTQTTMKRFDF